MSANGQDLTGHSRLAWPPQERQYDALRRLVAGAPPAVKPLVSYADLHALAGTDACGLSRRFPARAYHTRAWADGRGCDGSPRALDPHLNGGAYVLLDAMLLRLLATGRRRCDPARYVGAAHAPPPADLACPARCRACKDGAGRGGAKVSAASGACEQWCSKHHFCGMSSAYQVPSGGVDCRRCVGTSPPPAAAETAFGGGGGGGDTADAAGNAHRVAYLRQRSFETLGDYHHWTKAYQRGAGGGPGR